MAPNRWVYENSVHAHILSFKGSVNCYPHFSSKALTRLSPIQGLFRICEPISLKIKKSIW